MTPPPEPARPPRIEIPTLARRAALYGAAVLLVLTGFKLRAGLALKAAADDRPYSRVTVSEGELGSGALRDALVDSGSDPKEVQDVLRALKPLGGAVRQATGDRYRIERSTDGAILHVTLTRGRKRIVVTSRGGRFEAAAADPHIVLRHRSVRGTLHGSLWVSMRRAGAPVEVIQEYSDVFQWTVDFLTEPRDGDRFAVAWDEERTPDGRVWGRTVQAGLYEGRAAGRQVGIRFDGDYYDPKGQALESMFLRAPLNYRRISSTFSNRRWQPILRVFRPHHGIDYAAAWGTPVDSVGAGKVIFAGRRGGFGNCIEIKHADHYDTLYGHLSRIRVRVGQRVRQGQLIGNVGATGLATGPHLHFQISKNGVWLNFLALKIPRARSVPRARRSAFLALVPSRLASLESPSALSAR
ncbi:MAG: peptidoglycan DD-metalloendopeptidase family protein [Elusimicrobia bacterium]|nr:peptidoglycan DD-metalloendopeptidase family protein [Elusimicrobiota bacterium]